MAYASERSSTFQTNTVCFQNRRVRIGWPVQKRSAPQRRLKSRTIGPSCQPNGDAELGPDITYVNMLSNVLRQLNLLSINTCTESRRAKGLLGALTGERKCAWTLQRKHI